MKTSLQEEFYKFMQKKTPLYGIVTLLILMIYTALSDTISKDILVMGFGLGQWLFIILLTIGAEFIAMEYKENTIVTLFYKHSKKIHIYLSKFIVITLYGILLLLIGFFMTFILKIALAGNTYTWLSLYKSNHSLLTSLVLNVLGSLFYMLFTIALSFFLISLTRTNTLVIGVGLLIGFLGANFSTAIMQNFPRVIPLFKWNPLNMIYVVNQLSNSDYIEFSYLLNNQIIIGTLIYSLLFSLVGYWKFQKLKV